MNTNHPEEKQASESVVLTEKKSVRQIDWPVRMERAQLRWFPASSRLIGLVRANVDKFVLPPAVVRKASWRE